MASDGIEPEITSALGIYFFVADMMAQGGFKANPRFDGREYIFTKLAPLEWIRGRSCPLRLERITLGVILEISNVTVC